MVAEFSATSRTGYTLTKTANETGRYTVQLIGADGLATTYNKLLFVGAIFEGVADTAYTTDKGFAPMLRNVAVATTGKFDIQFMSGDANADAELEDAAVIRLHIVLKNSGV